MYQIICSTFTISTLLLLIILLINVYWYVKSKQKKRIKKVPGPNPQWIFGNLRNSGVATGQVAFHEAITSLKDTYGDVFSFWVGPYYSIVLSRIDHVQHVVEDRHTYDRAEPTSRNFGVLFPNGLIALRGANWKRHARFILPMFKRAKVLPCVETIVSCTDRFIKERLSPRKGEIHTDLVAQCQRLLLNVIALIAFDYDLESSSKPGVYDLRDAFNDFVGFANQFIIASGIPIWLGKLILKLNWKYQKALRTVKEYAMNMIVQEQKRQQQVLVTSKPKNLISSLVAAIQEDSTTGVPSLSSEEVFDEVFLSILAGFETTSTALSWFIFYMSKYPDVQKKIKSEIAEYNLTPDKPITAEILDSLTYIDCVTKEVLRYSPIAAVVLRQATCDDTIDDIEVKKGDTILLAIQNLHRDPRYWKVDPSKFEPERFLHEDKHPPRCAFMPFGEGHRSCAGQDLAFLELKTIITRLMQRVTIMDPGNEADNSGGFIQRITCFPNHLAVRIYLDQNKTTT